jgi:hypothetical protein
VSLKYSNRIAAALIGMAMMLPTASVQAEEGKTLLERAKDAVMGREVHELTLFSTVQNYQVSDPRATKSMLITVNLTGDDALAYFCYNQPRFREAVLRAITTFYRVSRGKKRLRADDVSRRTHALFSRYLEKDSMLKVKARFIENINEAGPPVKKTFDKCKAVTS